MVLILLERLVINALVKPRHLNRFRRLLLDTLLFFLNSCLCMAYFTCRLNNNEVMLDSLVGSERFFECMDLLWLAEWAIALFISYSQLQP